MSQVSHISLLPSRSAGRPRTIALLDRQRLSLADALDQDFNVLTAASHVPAMNELYASLLSQKPQIEAVVRHHLGLSAARDSCTVQPWQQWRRGAFNVCIMVEVQTGPRRFPWWHEGAFPEPQLVIVRCPMPYKVAEAQCPGSIDEKLRYEVGAYAWMQAHCSDIPIPHLYGFGTAGHQHFTHIDQLSWLTRLARRFWQWVARALGRPLVSNYCRRTPPPTPTPTPDARPARSPPRSTRSTPRTHKHTSLPPFSSAYMVLEYLAPDTTGRMLSETFPSGMASADKRRNLFRGMSRIMLSLARLPQARIGSFAFNAADATITLTGRPVYSAMKILENEGAEQFIAPDQTYTNTDAFVSDLISFHDRRFLRQPNATYDAEDCLSQLAAKTLLRVVAHRFIARERRDGPFFAQLTDLHASNMLVDDDWNLRGLIDLEWMCTLPAENLAVPYWLTNLTIDSIEGAAYAEFDAVRREFMDVFAREEARQAVRCSAARNTVRLARVMHDMWDSKGVWFWYCLSSVNAMYFVLESHILPKTLTHEAEPHVARFWSDDVDAVVQRKLADKEAYDEQVRRLFRR